MKRLAFKSLVLGFCAQGLVLGLRVWDLGFCIVGLGLR